MLSQRVVAMIEVVACSGFPTQIALSGVLAAAGIGPFDAHGALSKRYVFAVSLADAAAIVGLVVWFLRVHGEPARRVLLGDRPVWREALIGVLQIPGVYLLVLVVLLAVQRFAPWLRNVPLNPFQGLITTPTDAWLFAGVAVVAGGLREEIQRAFILHRFEQHLGGVWVGLLVSSVAFGFGHVIQGRDAVVATAALGAFWGLAYVRRRSIASTVVSHASFNAAEIFRYTF